MYYCKEDNYYEPYCEKECSGCQDKKTELKDIKYWMKALVEQLYSKEKLDYLDCEQCIEEICSVVDVKIPEGELTIDRKQGVKATYHPMLKEFDVEGWKSWNNNYLKQLKQIA